jgi:putative hydrolase of the HAD superfamily
MSIDTVLLDLDDTLVVEYASADEAIHAACLLAATSYPLSPDRVHDSVRRVAHREWYSEADHDYTQSIAVASWEALWARFEGDRPAMERLRESVPAYRKAVWRGALAEHGIVDDGLAEKMGLTFVATRRGLHTVYPDVAVTLAWLKPRFRLGIVTNGLSCLQREKLWGAGLGAFFDVVVAAGDTGIRKPDPANFALALEMLGSQPARAVMVGNSLRSDIAGGAAAGLRTVWINRQCAPPEDGIEPDAEIESLTELTDLLS